MPHSVWGVHVGSYVEARDSQARHHCTEGRSRIGSGGFSEIEQRRHGRRPYNSSSTTTTTNTTTTKPAVHNAAILGDLFPCRMHKFQCTECIGEEQLPYEDRTFCYTRASSRNDHFDSRHLPTLTQRLAQGLLKCVHPKCSKMVGKIGSMDQHIDHQLTVHHVKLRGVGGKAARSRKSSPAGGRRKKSKEPDLVVWSVESPATPIESFYGEGVCQA